MKTDWDESDRILRKLIKDQWKFLETLDKIGEPSRCVIIERKTSLGSVFLPGGVYRLTEDEPPSPPP